MPKPVKTILMAGVPSINQNLFHKIRFPVGDSAAFIERIGGGAAEKILFVRDIERERARKLNRYLWPA